MSSGKSKRLELSNTWGSSSQLYVTINGYTARAVYYQNGKSSWTSEEAASAIANLINGSSGAHPVSHLIDPNLTGARASISVDDPSTVIIRSTIVDGPLEVSYLTGTSNGSPGSVSLKEDNNVDDSVASNPTISASIANLSNTSQVVINTSYLQGDTENVY